MWSTSGLLSEREVGWGEEGGTMAETARRAKRETDREREREREKGVRERKGVYVCVRKAGVG